MFGADSYYFLSNICEHTLTEHSSIPVGAQVFFGQFPCSELGVKIFSFFALLIATLWMSGIGELISKKFGWLAGPLAFLSNYWVFTFFSFEDDVLGLLILLPSLYFLVKAREERKPLFKWLSLFSCLLAGLFWKGALLWLVSYAIVFVPALIALIGVFFFILNNDIGSILGAIAPNMSVLENHPVTGVFYQLGLLLGIAGFTEVLVGPTIFWLTVVMVNEKFAVMLTIFLSLALVSWLDSPKIWVGLHKIIFQKPQFLFVFAVFGLTLTAAFHVFTAYPHENQLNAVDYAIDQASGGKIYNDWSYGHWIDYYGGTALTRGGPPEKNVNNVKGIYLSERELSCQVLKDFGMGFNDDVRVYSCP